MDARLLALIRAYQSATAAALAEFLVRSGLPHPFNWRAAGLPRVGTLDGAPPLHYRFHGAGLAVRPEGGRELDFDFGHDGRTSGFNEWWLSRFVEDSSDAFPEFRLDGAVAAALDAAVSAGEVVQPFRDRQDDLYYLATDVEPAA